MPFLRIISSYTVLICAGTYAVRYLCSAKKLFSIKKSFCIAVRKDFLFYPRLYAKKSLFALCI